MRFDDVERPPLRLRDLRRALVAHSGFARFDLLGETGSTNDDLIAAAQADPDVYPHLSVLAAEHQTAGHGRISRSWQVPAYTSVLASVLVRPQPHHVKQASWLPLVAGLAACEGLTQALTWLMADDSRGHAPAMIFGPRGHIDRFPNRGNALRPATGLVSGENVYEQLGQRPRDDAGAAGKTGLPPDPDAGDLSTRFFEPAGQENRSGTAGKWAGPPISAPRSPSPRMPGIRTKWPNDVVVDFPEEPWAEGWGTSRKLGGILVQGLPDQSGYVVGFGLNVLQRPSELPVPWATSLAIVARDQSPSASIGAVDPPAPNLSDLAVFPVRDSVGSVTLPLRGPDDPPVSSVAGPAIPLSSTPFLPDRSIVLRTVLRAFAFRYAQWEQAASNPAAASQLTADVAACCATIGHQVSITQPDGGRIEGQAIALAPNGALVVKPPDGPPQPVTIGDVHLLRLS